MIHKKKMYQEAKYESDVEAYEQDNIVIKKGISLIGCHSFGLPNITPISLINSTLSSGHDVIVLPASSIIAIVYCKEVKSEYSPIIQKSIKCIS